MKMLARSTYDFKTLIENDCVYVDKTECLLRLVQSQVDARYFISRPRRFGKSLMLSTLRYYFEGQGHLFAGLNATLPTISPEEPYPVIMLDMAAVQSDSVELLEQNLRSKIVDDVRMRGLNLEPADYPQAKMLFGAYIGALAQKSPHGKVVVLVDEYDAPVTRLLENPEVCAKAQEAMHDFYIQLKTHDSEIRFLMMTGVSKFAKLSVFSGLNNLVDLSEAPEFAAMLGYTEAEIDRYLRPHVEAFAHAHGCDYTQMKQELLTWYDSYRFSPRSDVRVCNPVSLGSALNEQDLLNYWEKTGNSKMVYRLLKDRGLLPEDLTKITIRREELDVCPVDSWMKPSFLYQCGYLTIKQVHADGTLDLGIPNEEIKSSLEHGFMSYLLGENADAILRTSKNARVKLEGGERVDMILRETLHSAFALLPYEWRCGSEAEVKRMFLFFCRFLGASIIGERQSAIGRADAILELDHSVYLFEFKYDGSAVEALQQIKDRHYAESYLEDARPIYLVGVNYSSENRVIDAPAVEQWDRRLVGDSDGNSSGETLSKPQSESVSQEVDGAVR